MAVRDAQLGAPPRCGTGIIERCWHQHWRLRNRSHGNKLAMTHRSRGAGSLGAGAWELELGAGAWELEPGSWSLGAGAWELGAWELELEPGSLGGCSRQLNIKLDTKTQRRRAYPLGRGFQATRRLMAGGVR